jgi:tetratricopeptide (TPR) repeat protein
MKASKRDAAIAAFQAGARSHQAGDLASAEGAYRQALRLMPDFAACVALFGVLLHQTGRSAQAVTHLRRATALQPGVAQHQHNLGGVLRDMGRLGEAVVAFRAALRLDGSIAETHRNLGCALRDLGEWEQASKALRTALSLQPRHADAANDLGIVLDSAGRTLEALGWFELACQFNPADPVPHNNRGAALRELDRPEEAIICLREAVRLNPRYAHAWANLGNALQDLEDADAALECFGRALSLEPNAADAFVNLGQALYRHRRLDEARDVYGRGLEANPGSAAITWNLSNVLLALGDYAAGWAAFEARWRLPDLAQAWHRSEIPTWTPEKELDGQTILLFAEQGFGDTLQFVRFAPLLSVRGARVILLVQPALVSLVGAMERIAACVGFGDSLPQADLQYPLMSLPFALGIDLASLPAVVPYLKPNTGAVVEWRDRLAALPGRKVGLVWSGDPRPDQPNANRIDRRRSMTFEQFTVLAGISGVSFVSLQKGAPAAQALGAAGGPALHDWTGELRSFADTAALVSALDLVISVDTAVAHLAAGLGRPVWMLNRFDSCWRWLQGRDDSPWYPTLRQFRQTAPGDWAGVMERVVAALQAFAATN